MGREISEGITLLEGRDPLSSRHHCLPGGRAVRAAT
jgi:hypothetical protein